MQSASNPGPSYLTRGAEEIDGNPVAAHLPIAPETDDDAFLALAVKPEFEDKDRRLPGAIRRIRVNRLRRFFLPHLPVHRSALNGICTAVHDGYIARNPMTPEGQRLLHGYQVDLPYSPVITMVTGYSGMGKSTLVTRTLKYLGNQVVPHTSFNGQPFAETQLVWLRRNVPEQCTVKTLCSTFGAYADNVLGLKLYAGAFAKRSGVDRDLYLEEIRKIILTHHVGVLILDEFQNLTLMGLGAKKIIAFLVNLRDDLGLPIVVIGTYKALKLLRSELAAARRLAEGGYFDIQRPTTADDPHWQELCQATWQYQWVRKPIEYSQGIGDVLYEVSQGITGVMVTAIATAQMAAIEDGSERVTEALVRKVFEERMTPLHPAIRVLASGDPRLMDQFDDVYKNFWPGADPNEIEGGEQPDRDAAVQAQAKTDAPVDRRVHGDATRGPRKARQGAGRPAPVLPESKIKDLVMANSIQDLVGLLEGT